jgi:hypothetical protein
VVLVRDLMFRSKISATARAAGVEVKIEGQSGRLLQQPGRLLLVDLGDPGAIEAAVAWKQKHRAPAIGFVSHVDADTIARARAAGIDRVMARSAFTAELESLLKPDD